MNIDRLYSFKELDQALKRPKGSAFRLFKTRLDELAEGHDFIVLNHQSEAQQIQQLKDSGRVYRQSVNVVLLTPESFERLRREAEEQSS